MIRKPLLRQTIVTLYQSGHSLTQIARMVNLTDEPVRKHLIGAGVPRRRGITNRKLPSNEEVSRLYLSGLDGNQIARMFGVVGGTAVHQKLRQSGVLARVGKHGMHRSREYRAWADLIQRCRPEYPGHECYADRGITVFPGWRNDFMAFFAHIGPRPSAKHSVDRIDNSRGYEPGNVRWATMKEQNRNRRNNRLLTINGETKVLADWAVVASVSRTTIEGRLRQGWSPEDAVFRPRTTRGTAA